MVVAQKRILVIDDDPDFLDYVTIVLSTNGYVVHTACSASDGLRMMRVVCPHLVIADVMMSFVLDGWTISREMHADPDLCEIPVLMVSAIVSDKDDDLFPAGESGRVDAFMSKPLEPSALLECVSELTQKA